ncbi:MAG: SH3 domain-containing protein [Chloroflexi bacterium]|nr:SH3 domain-containing protein [Chloroflexota bacterium]
MTDTQYYQNDSRWKDVKIGADQNMTIGMVGCLLTSLTMVMDHFGANETPQTLNQKMVASGGFNGAWIKGFMVPGLFPQYGVKRQKYVECKNKPAPMADIDAGLEVGSLIVVQVDREEDRAFEDEDGHWVVLVKKTGTDYDMWDPWKKDGAPTTLVGRYGFGKKVPADIIQQAIWHGKGDLVPKAADKPAPAKPTTAKPATAAPADNSPLAVKPTVGQLTMRREAAVTQTNVIKTLSANDVLQVLDGAAQSRGKIGQQNQWLRVRDAQGSEGYVAAWYIKETAATASKASPTPQPAASLNVKINSASISFRSAPQVADNTLISYLTQGTVLQVIEAGKAAAKIGQQGQWLHVKTADGTQGYIAAWLVTRA